MTTQTTAELLRALRILFALHGAPLVLKCDNGSSFRSDLTKQLLARCGVEILFSPPGLPAYNGSIEAANGSLKTRTAAQAEAQNSSAFWTSEHLDAARHQANTTPRRRLQGLTPEAKWDTRTHVPPAFRAQFRATVTQQRLEAQAELGLTAEDLTSHWKATRADRKAISRALGAHGLLEYRRRRILPRI